MIFKNKKFWVIVLGFVFVVAIIDAYFVRKYQEVPPRLFVGTVAAEQKPAVPRVATTSPSIHLDNAKLAEMSTIQELSARWRALNPPLDIVEAWSPKYMRWANDNGYTLTIPTEESVMLAKQSALFTGDIVDTFFSTEMQVAREMFERRGFILNQINSSVQTRGTFSYDYVQAYEKGEEHCMVVVNLENMGYSRDIAKMGYTLTAMCGGSIVAAEKEQQPLLDALNYRNTGMKVGYIIREGAFVKAGVSGDRGGQEAILKQEGSQYRVLLKTQEAPPCEVVDTEKIPMSFLKTIGYHMCYESKGGVRQF